MFVTNWISTTKIQKISEITNFFRHYFYPELRYRSKNLRHLRNLRDNTSRKSGSSTEQVAFRVIRA